MSPGVCISSAAASSSVVGRRTATFSLPRRQQQQLLLVLSPPPPVAFHADTAAASYHASAVRPVLVRRPNDEPPEPHPRPVTFRPLRIMPLGTSETVGTMDRRAVGYRQVLIQQLRREHQLDACLVGTRATDGRAHEAYPHMRVHELAEKAVAAAEKLRPDVITAYLGAGDLGMGYRLAELALRVRRLLEPVWAACPSALALLATLKPHRREPFGDERGFSKAGRRWSLQPTMNVDVFNDQLRDLVAELQAQQRQAQQRRAANHAAGSGGDGRRILLAEMRDPHIGLTPADLEVNTRQRERLTQTGYDKMAKIWARTIVAADAAGLIERNIKDVYTGRNYRRLYLTPEGEEEGASRLRGLSEHLPEPEPGWPGVVQQELGGRRERTRFKNRWLT